ncbi:alpha/beta fold hydrolase [Intrasporangium mesophilum]
MNGAASHSAPDTIVLIHGFWVTPRSWENWKAHYETRGFHVLTPAYPGLEVEVEALRANPTPIEQLTVPRIIGSLEELIGGLDRPPIIMGHSAGGAFTQILLDHGCGAAGVGINSAPTEGVKVIPFSEIKSSFPVLKNPANRHKAVGLTPKQWFEIFANTMTQEESLALYERYHIPASGAIFWGSALANIHPGHDDTYVNYHNDARAPLLLISGRQDPLFPPKVGHSNVNHYKSNTITEIIEFDGPHLLPAVPHWKTIADFALDWALNPTVNDAAHAWPVDPSHTEIRRD